MYSLSMPTSYQFPQVTEVSQYLPTMTSSSYNINDYLPSRVHKINLKQHIPVFELNFKQSELSKEYVDKIQFLESKIIQLSSINNKKQKTYNQNTQTDVSSFDTKRLGWGQKIQITIIPVKKTYQQVSLQTDNIVQEVKKEVSIIAPPIVPKLQLSQPTLTIMPPSQSKRTFERIQKTQRVPFLTERGKQNINIQKYNIKPIIKNDSVQLYPIKTHELMDIVRMMLSN